MSYAFHSDATKRDAMLARLASPHAHEHVVAVFASWDGARGSAMGYLHESEDPAAWEAQSGITQSVALAIDALAAQATAAPSLQPDAATPAAVAGTLMAAIPVGATLVVAPAAIAQSILRSPLFALSAWVSEPGLQRQMVAVAELHARTADGDAVTTAEWRAARRAAMSMTDKLASSLQAALSTCLESLCWDMAQSPAALADGLRAWAQAVEAHADQQFGWSESDDAQVRARLDNLHARAQRESASPGIDVFALYEHHHPQEASRTQARLDHVRQVRRHALHDAVIAVRSVLA